MRRFTVNSSPCLPARPRAGFTLVEALVSLGVIGVLSSIALAWYSGARREVLERVTNRRNAQEIVSVAVCATVAGADFVEQGDKFATVQNLVKGAKGTSGVWKDRLFSLTNVQPQSIADALPYIAFDAGLLLFDPTGEQP